MRRARFTNDAPFDERGAQSGREANIFIVATCHVTPRKGDNVLPDSFRDRRVYVSLKAYRERFWPAVLEFL
jgi:hypothetical protein